MTQILRPGLRVMLLPLAVLFGLQVLCNLSAPNPDQPTNQPTEGISATGAADTDEPGSEEPLIPSFPWPPPKASATAILSLGELGEKAGSGLLLEDVDEKIQAALDANGDDERQYYGVPGGFAIVTRMERMKEDGSSDMTSDRWAADTSDADRQYFSIGEYLQALFGASKGYYRMFVFIITTTTVSSSPHTPTQEEAMEWTTSGAMVLPNYLGQLEYSADYSCSVYVYQFEQPGKGEKVNLAIPSSLTGKQHLQKAKLWDLLEK